MWTFALADCIGSTARLGVGLDGLDASASVAAASAIASAALLTRPGARFLSSRYAARCSRAQGLDLLVCVDGVHELVRELARLDARAPLGPVALRAVDRDAVAELVELGRLALLRRPPLAAVVAGALAGRTRARCRRCFAAAAGSCASSLLRPRHALTSRDRVFMFSLPSRWRCRYMPGPYRCSKSDAPGTWRQRWRARARAGSATWGLAEELAHRRGGSRATGPTRRG